jgi:LysR family nitrogen assimilation transcriptional regulator
MDLRRLRAFVAVYEERSFGRAATRANTTQPALSVQIAALEAELNAILFDRHSKGVTPTTAGRRLYGKGVRLLRDAADLVGELRSLSGKIIEPLVGGIPPTLSKAVLAPILLEYVNRYPDVDIRVSEAYSTTLLSLLEARKLDFALVTYVPDQAHLQFEPIYRDRFVAVFSSRFRAAHEGPIRLDEAPYQKLVIHSLQHGLHWMLEAPFRTRRIVPSRMIEIDGLSGALEFVSRTDWIALLPYAAVHNVTGANIAYAPLAGPDIAIEYYVAHPARIPMSQSANAFVEIARDELQKVAQAWDKSQSHPRVKHSTRRPRTAVRIA